MLKKVLKYDIADVKKLWIIIAIVNLAVSIASALVFRHVMHYVGSADQTVLESILMIFEIIFIFISFTWLAASWVVLNIRLFVQYYNRCFTDEGYLTFTLPVPRKTIFLSKTLNSLIWTGLHDAVFVVCVLIILTVAPYPEQGVINPVVFNGIGKLLSAGMEQVGGWLVVELFLGVLIILLYQCASLMLMHFAATSAGVGKSKLIVALLLWLGLGYGAGIVISIVVTNAADGIMILTSALSVGQANLVATLFMLLAVLIELAVSAFLYFASLNKLESKLNLS